MLLMFYKSVSDLGKSEYKISHFKFTTLNQETNEENEFFFVLPEEDIEIMRQDWQTIIDKIKDGRAHEISESDTNYLSACTKGSSSKTVRKQPFSETHAKQRAFSLKTTYMTHFINNYIMKRGQSERLIKDVEELKNKKFEQIIMDKFAPYYGMTIEELALSFNLGISNKSINNRIVAAILDIKGNINESDEFQKASIISKTIRIETSGKIKESMSFPAIDFERLIEDEWEDSEFYSQIGLSRFMFTIFVSDGEQYRLKETIFWNMPEDDLEQAKEVWELTKDMVKNNRLDIGGKHGFSVTNFPKSSDNNVSHVRPHDKDMKMGRIELWGGKKIAKYGFWLNCKYICKILGEKNVIHKS
jgi:DNA mismatch repair protein MutH